MKALKELIKKQKNSLLVKPMKYGVISGGKKIRSTIIFDTGKIFNIKEKKLINVCAAETILTVKDAIDFIQNKK